MDIKETLKLKEIDQLESAILQFSNNTLTTKKICASLLIGIITIILKLTDNEFDFAIYTGCMACLIIFWIIDSYSYYYQRKLRIRMTEIVNEYRSDQFITDGYGIPLKKEEKPSWKKAFFNTSQFFYYAGFTVVIILIIVDACGLIK